MQTIIIKYYGWTNTKPACKRGWTSGNPQKRWTFSNGTSATEAAEIIAKELDWHGTWNGGHFDNDTTVFVSNRDRSESAELFTIAPKDRENKSL